MTLNIYIQVRYYGFNKAWLINTKAMKELAFIVALLPK